jgi:hypothetical protein
MHETRKDNMEQSDKEIHHVFGELIKTHVIGEYKIVEYHPYIVERNVFTSDINYNMKRYELPDVGYNYSSLDAAILGAICHKYDCGMLSYPIERMIGMAISKQEEFNTPSLQEAYNRIQIAIHEIEDMAGSNDGILPVKLLKLYNAMMDRQLILASELERKINWEPIGKRQPKTLDELLKENLIYSGLIEKEKRMGFDIKTEPNGERHPEGIVGKLWKIKDPATFKVGNCFLNGRLMEGDIFLCVRHSGDCFQDYIIVEESSNRFRGKPEFRFGSYGVGDSECLGLLTGSEIEILENGGSFRRSDET